MKSSVLLKRYQIIALPPEAPVSGARFPPCSLKWRNRVLWVRARRGGNLLPLPALENERWLIDCLSHSRVREVCLDPALGEETIAFWANACRRAGKTAILRVSAGVPPSGRDPAAWWVKRVLDRVAAAFLLLVFSPILLALAYFTRTTSPGPLLFRQWRVGENGRLFQVFQFRSMVADAEKPSRPGTGDPLATRPGGWTRRYNLDELPQLVNVLRGELSLVGPRPLALPEALRPGASARKRLKALPGITGLGRVTGGSAPRDPETLGRHEIEYLLEWSLWKDLAILLRTIPKVLSGTRGEGIPPGKG